MRNGVPGGRNMMRERLTGPATGPDGAILFRIRICVAVAGLLILGAGTAGATGYELREQSAVGQGAAMAGAAARGDDPSFLFFNPAAIGWLSGTQIGSVGSVIFPRAQADQGSATRAAVLGGSPIGGDLGGQAGLTAFVPAFHASTALGEQWHLGLSLTSPWGLVTKYDNGFIGRYHAITSSLRTINVTPAVAWRPVPELSIGVALQIQYAAARLSSDVDFGAIGALTPALSRAGFRPGSADGRSTVTGNDTAFGWLIGAQWEPRPGTRLGASFRSAVFHGLKGDVQFEGVPAPLRPAFTGSQARAQLTTPETATLGLSQRIDDRWTVLVGVEWTNWSRFRDLAVRFDSGRPTSVTEERWRDSWFVSIGGEYHVRPDITLRAGLAWDQSPVPEATRTPRIPDNNRYWLSAGASWQATQSITFSVAYTHIFVADAQVNLRDDGPGTVNFLRGNLSASYRSSVDIIALQARLAF